MTYYQIDGKIYYFNLDAVFELVSKIPNNEKIINTTITQYYGGDSEKNAWNAVLQCVPPLILTVKINNIPKYQRAEAEKDETEIHHRRHLDVRNRFQHFRKEDDKNHQDHLEHLKGNAADSCMVVVEKDKLKQIYLFTFIKEPPVFCSFFCKYS